MDETPELTVQDLTHLRRCVELAREALADGDEPFGSVLVDPHGVVLHEDRNRTAGGDQTRHPELELSRWAAAHVAPEARPASTVYTSGEHCPMCAAGHAWVGLGRTGTQHRLPSSPSGGTVGASWPARCHRCPSTLWLPGLPVAGPALALADELRELHQRAAEREVAS